MSNHSNSVQAESRLAQTFFGRVLSKFPFIDGIWRDAGIVPGIAAGAICFAGLRVGPQRLAKYFFQQPRTPFQRAYQPGKVTYYSWLVIDSVLSLAVGACWGLVFCDQEAVLERLGNLPNVDDTLDCHQALQTWNELREQAGFPIENPLNPSLEAARQFTLTCAKKIGSTDPYWNLDMPIPEASKETTWTDGEDLFAEEDGYGKD